MIDLQPFTSDLFAITGVVPAGWRELEPGFYTRGDPDEDPTFLFQLSAPGGEIGDRLQELLADVGVDSPLPEPIDRIESSAFSWNLYALELPLPLGVAVALSDSRERVYLVTLIAPREELDALAETVFMPAVMALTPAE